MPLIHTLDHAGGFLRVVADGVLDASDLSAWMATIQSELDAANIRRILFDLRSAIPGLAFADMVDFHDHLVHILGDRPPQRWATLIATPVGYGLVRMFISLSEDLPLTVASFTDASAAITWLRGNTSPPEDESSPTSI